MKRSKFLKLRNSIHRDFSICFTLKKRSFDGIDTFYLVAFTGFVPSYFRDYVHNFGFSLSHFSDGMSIIE